MFDFKEELLQFIWQHKLLKPMPLITTSGKEIEIIKTGDLNKDSGPDFFNARIKINELFLAGNIEIHIKTSDWLLHKHQKDKSYDNLILHVVYEHDKELNQNTLNNVEVLQIKNLIPESVFTIYKNLVNSKNTLACAGQLDQVDDLKFTSWLQRMFAERLELKVYRIDELFSANGSNYSETFYTLLMRNFGFKVNALPFELLAKQLPLSVLIKHANNLLQLEALLLGTSGFLEEQYSDEYIRNLQNEFEYLKIKYKIVPLQKEIFKFSKLRPANFPTLRLAQMARVIFLNPGLFQSPVEFDSFRKIESAFNVNMAGYWKRHYTLDGTNNEHNLKMGNDSITSIIINSFAPFFFFYYKKTGIPKFENLSFKLLEACKFEANAKTKLFKTKKILLKNGADSQALINLHDNYCIKRKCLNCGIAAAILK